MTKNELPPEKIPIKIIYGDGKLRRELTGIIYGTPFEFRNYTCVPFLREGDEVKNLLSLRVDLIKTITILSEGVFHPIINYQLCADCSQQCGCIAGAFSIEYSREKHTFSPVIRPQKCTGCERCLERCKRGAIKIIRVGAVCNEK